MNPGNNLFEILFEKMKSLLRTETVVGEPFQVGRITLVPLLTVSFIVGGGEEGPGEARFYNASNYGAGVGCKISPSAMLIIKNEEVSVVPLAEKGSLERIVEMLPEIISGINCSSPTKRET
ncbi:MAG: spore germination protein GerW family protein [Bacillota bacterium]